MGRQRGMGAYPDREKETLPIWVGKEEESVKPGQEDSIRGAWFDQPSAYGLGDGPGAVLDV
jgi:hypothetical protein